MYRAVVIVLLMVCVSTPVAARSNGREPCDRGAGGVSHCEGRFFICKNGKVSQSKKICPDWLNGSTQSSEQPKNKKK